MSMLSGMNGMLDNEAALESAMEQLEEMDMLAMEADAIIDSMVDEDEDLDDELEELEDEDALESFAELSIKMDEIASEYVKNGTEPDEALEAAYCHMTTAADEFFEDDPVTAMEVQSTLDEIHELNTEAMEGSLTGDSFLKSLTLAGSDYDTEDNQIGFDDSEAEFRENASDGARDTNDPNTTDPGSIGFDDAVADFEENQSGEDALESLLQEVEDMDLTDELDDALDSILD